MCCSFPSLCFFLVLLLSSAAVIPSGSAADNHSNASKQLKPSPETATAQSSMVQSELDTLFRIMEIMSSDRTWRISYPNPCNPGSSWTGIECKTGKNNHLHVSRLDFGNPPNPSCKAAAIFPPEIFQLPYLESAFFFHCFTHSTTTTIAMPASAVTNSSLEQLSLRSNPSLVGRIPAQLSSLKSLQVLTLSQNHLSGKIPLQIFRLKSLVHLDLSYNSLTGALPYEVGNLRNLVGLDLSYNSLSGIIPNSIGELGQLQKLDLSSNLLVGRIPSSIEKLTSLVFIALGSNLLRGSFPQGLTKLVNLQYFIMDDNPMNIPLPREFGVLVKLQELRLSNSGFSGTIPPSFSQLVNLITLSLQNNRLTGGIPVGLSSLSHLYHLNLSRNFLKGTVPFNGSFLKRLGRNLDLSGNEGLCLDPNEAYGLKIGVDVCGSHSGYSVVQARKKSDASSLLHLLSVYSMLSPLGLQLLMLFFSNILM